LFRPQNGKEFIQNAGPIFKFSLTRARRGDAGHVLCSLCYSHDGATVRLIVRGHGPPTSPMSIPQMIHELIWNSGLMAGETGLGEKPVQVPLAWVRTRTSAVRNFREVRLCCLPSGSGDILLRILTFAAHFLLTRYISFDSLVSCVLASMYPVLQRKCSQ
jgi:hypothetical protein